MAKLNPKDKLFGKSDPASPTPRRGRGRPKNDMQMGRYTYYLPKALGEMIADYAYWERKSISVVLAEICKPFFADKKPKPRPEQKTVRDVMGES